MTGTKILKTALNAKFDPQTGARTKETKTYIRGVEECTYENDKYGNPTTIKTCRIKKSDDGTEDKEYYPEINIEYTYEENKITATEDSGVRTYEHFGSRRLDDVLY